MSDYSSFLRELLSITIQELASDLHISVGQPPIIRINGRLVPLMKMKELTAEDAQALAFEIMTADQQQRFLKEKEIDFSYSVGEKARFRVNIFFQRGYISCALRLIPAKIPTPDELNLPSI
ncbi:MAG: hypothetical protein US98_C0009G0013, partial [Parcubacteria group bacterium GW2011_GWC1_38_6]